MQWKIKIAPEKMTRTDTRLHPVVEALLEERGYLTPEDQDIFLMPDYARDIHDPFLFLAMEAVVTRFGQAKERGELVGIFGDFDADGVTSSVIMREGLDMLGIKNVVYLPDKLTEGHGLNTKAVDSLVASGASLIVTLDCGMMNHVAIDYANSLGGEVIVIDHHHVPEVLPSAYAIVNPKLPNETYPFRELCGAGTTFKVVQAMVSRFAPEEVEQLKWLLDVVATGTVADVMPLIGENRTLVKYGLIVLSKTRRKGFQKMISVGRIPIDQDNVPTAETIAFQIAPRINAASRMAHAQLAHDLLMAGDDAEAETLAAELQKWNTARQKQSQKITDEIKLRVESEMGNMSAIVAAAPHYPYGIVGLIAGRLANAYQKPSVIITEEGEFSRGSLRSVPGFSVILALESCADLLEKYGGHEQAAGLTVRTERLAEFTKRFQQTVTSWREENEQQISEDSQGERELELAIDFEVTPGYITDNPYRELSKMAPFGEGNREPVFLMRGVEVADLRAIGTDAKHLKMKLILGESKKLIDCIGFGLGQWTEKIAPGDKIDLVFTLDENIWNGRTNLQLKVIDLKK
jgi:single-stranded-DNA-specific exonuclease